MAALASGQASNVTGTSEQRERLGFVDGLRALTAMYVVIHHIMQQIWPPEYGINATRPFSYITRSLSFGQYSVELFIVISGFCLMLPVIKNKGSLKGWVKTFFIKRARRILPPYYFSLAFSLLLVAFFIGNKTGTHWDCSLPVTARSIISHIFLMHDIIPFDGLINYVLWSIAVEWHIYFFFPLFVLGWRRLGPWWFVAVALTTSFSTANLISHTMFAGITAQFYGLFTLGMLAAVICYGQDPIWERLRKGPWSVITLLSALSFLSLHHWIKTGLVIDLGLGFFGLSVLIAASQPHNVLARLLSWRPLVVIGGFSYSLYLTHAPLIQVIWQYAIHPLHQTRYVEFALLTVIGAPLMILFAYVFYIYCEKPYMNKPITKVA